MLPPQYQLNNKMTCFFFCFFFGCCHRRFILARSELRTGSPEKCLMGWRHFGSVALRSLIRFRQLKTLKGQPTLSSRNKSYGNINVSFYISIGVKMSNTLEVMR